MTEDLRAENERLKADRPHNHHRQDRIRRPPIPRHRTPRAHPALVRPPRTHPRRTGDTMIRKEAKARWVYECQPCGERVEAVDQFRVIEAMHRHQRGNLTHIQNVLAEAMKPVMDFMNKFAAQAESLHKTLFEPPKNLPHDPSLRNDRRKWGGR